MKKRKVTQKSSQIALSVAVYLTVFASLLSGYNLWHNSQIMQYASAQSPETQTPEDLPNITVSPTATDGQNQNSNNQTNTNQNAEAANAQVTTARTGGSELWGVVFVAAICIFAIEYLRNRFHLNKLVTHEKKIKTLHDNDFVS